MKKIYLSVIAGIVLSLFICNSFAGNNTPILKKNTSNNTVGGDTVTKSFAVSGNGACKSTIENTLTGNPGVVSANWDSTAKVITVTFVWSTIKKSQLCRLLANAGYDNAQVRSKDAIYATLPTACQYSRTPISQ